MTTEENSSLVDTRKNVANIDLLNRQEFIEQLINITENLSANNGNACYAINGVWGAGKTYVLEAFEKKLRTYEKDAFTLNKYLVFHYNCWQYDYYEEPLIAIVAATLDQIDEQVHLMPEDKKEIFVAVLKTIGISVLGKACSIIAEKSGIDFERIAEIIKTGDEEATQKIIAEHKFDSYFDFKKTLKKLSEAMESLAQEQTVIFVVDELDRCLPEYAIKVLERLHHIFADIPNVQVILAVDKSQLENTIKRIYGEEISVRRYLAKFIDFELTLVTGEISSEVRNIVSFFDLDNETDACRYGMKACVKEINRRLREQKVSLKRAGYNIPFAQYHFRLFVKAHNWKVDPEFCQINVKNEYQKEYCYSMRLINKIIEEISQNPATIIEELREKVGQKEQKDRDS